MISWVAVLLPVTTMRRPWQEQALAVEARLQYLPRTF
jgi:hypothetical protein